MAINPQLVFNVDHYLLIRNKAVIDGLQDTINNFATLFSFVSASEIFLGGYFVKESVLKGVSLLAIGLCVGLGAINIWRLAFAERWQKTKDMAESKVAK